MADTLHIPSGTKEEKYRQLLPQIEALVSGEKDPIANMGNICSAIKYGLNIFWVGFYLLKGNELVLGPFQGTVACTRIQKGKGVCGVVWEKNETLIVPDVEKFPGHIACSALSRSEIVIPLYNEKKEFIGVLDLDSDVLNSFDATDEKWLRKITELLV